MRVFHFYIVLLLLGSRKMEAFSPEKSEGQSKNGDVIPESIADAISMFEPAVYDVTSVAEQHVAACNQPYDATIVIEIYAFERYFTLILKQHTQLFSPYAKVHIRSGDAMEEYDYDFRTLYTGKVAGDTQSTVTGRILDGIFDGSFYTAGERFHLEPSFRYFQSPVPFHSILFPSGAVNFNMSQITLQGQQVQRWRRSQAKDFIKQTPPRARRSALLSDNSSALDTCTLHITADRRFLEHVGEGSVDKTIAEMLYHVSEVDKIFRATDFNQDSGPGDNIGINVAAVTVYMDAYAEGSLASPESIAVVEYLNKWSSINHNDYCIAILFTFRDFAEGVLGLAWVGNEEAGGICSRRIAVEESSDAMNFNTAVISFMNYGVRVPRKASVVTLAHEIGHSFGSEHDPSTTLCQPGDNYGRFIMYALAVDGSKSNNFIFSQCSKAAMWPIIYNKGPICFVAQNRGAYCGNKLVEVGEQCDCGLPHQCSTTDTCCDPGNFTSEVPTCTVKPGNQCSPKKGPCCSYDCTFIAQSQQKICHDETDCVYQSVCNGSMAQCPTPLSKPTNTTCNGGANTCLDSSCVGPICTKYGLDQCECVDHEQMCHVCCETQEGGCVSSEGITGGIIYKLPGSTCNSYTGYCDQTGQCVTVDTDDQMSRLKESFKRMTSRASINATMKWLSNNWYYVVVVALGICLVALLMKFLSWQHNPSALLPRHRASRPRTATTDTADLSNEGLEMQDVLDDDVTSGTMTPSTSYVSGDASASAV